MEMFISEEEPSFSARAGMRLHGEASPGCEWLPVAVWQAPSPLALATLGTLASLLGHIGATLGCLLPSCLPLGPRLEPRDHIAHVQHHCLACGQREQRTIRTCISVLRRCEVGARVGADSALHCVREQEMVGSNAVEC
ncbi:unnamed protein product [Ixodes persulcatus]